MASLNQTELNAIRHRIDIDYNLDDQGYQDRMALLDHIKVLEKNLDEFSSAIGKDWEEYFHIARTGR